MKRNERIGFIGQGWIGKNYADDFERRGYKVVRYGLEPEYKNNLQKIAECRIVFIAVPTPSTPRGFDDRVIRSVLPLVGKGKIAVIKSTLSIGLTRILQADFPDRTVIHSPEFLSERTAAHDAAHPDRTVVGLPRMGTRHRAAARLIMSILPKAPFELVCSSEEAEIIKYAHNIHGFIQVVLSNILYDTAHAFKADWNRLKKAFIADPMMSHQYLNPVHKTGRGAGGHCFIKDFEAFIGAYARSVKDPVGLSALRAIRDKNISLLVASGKDLDLLRAVYGPKNVSRPKRARLYT